MSLLLLFGSSTGTTTSGGRGPIFLVIVAGPSGVAAFAVPIIEADAPTPQGSTGSTGPSGSASSPTPQGSAP